MIIQLSVETGEGRLNGLVYMGVEIQFRKQGARTS